MTARFPPPMCGERKNIRFMRHLCPRGRTPGRFDSVLSQSISLPSFSAGVSSMICVAGVEVEVARPIHPARAPFQRYVANRCVSHLLIIQRSFMGRVVIVFAFFLFSALAVSPGEKADYRDFAIDTCYPTANEIRLAEEHVRSYWIRNAARFGAEPRFLAVETTKIFSSEIQDLGIKLIHSQTTSSYYSERKNAVNPPLRCVMIFDIKANRFIGNQGYVAVDVPPRGQVARFSTYLARYVGTAR
jgi:hypothetical protein